MKEIIKYLIYFAFYMLLGWAISSMFGCTKYKPDWNQTECGMATDIIQYCRMDSTVISSHTDSAQVCGINYTNFKNNIPRSKWVNYPGCSVFDPVNEMQVPYMIHYITNLKP